MAFATQASTRVLRYRGAPLLVILKFRAMFFPSS